MSRIEPETISPWEVFQAARSPGPAGVLRRLGMDVVARPGDRARDVLHRVLEKAVAPRHHHAEALVPLGPLRDHVDPDGTRRWLHTGDLGYFDEDGYLFITDRKKDLIKTSGYQVWPREVEEVLAAHPAVAEVGVTGVADEMKGEAIRAWVVLRTGQTISGDELRSYCREKLAPYKVPSKVELRAELPKTMVGKVLRRALREEAEAEQARR